MAIYVYNRNDEDHSGEANNYDITRPNILSNPYTHIRDRKTLARYVCKSREEAIAAYDHYFDVMYSGNKEFKEKVDEIYEKYKNGEDIFLSCACHPLPCHGDVIAKKLQRRLIKEKVQEARNGYKRD